MLRCAQPHSMAGTVPVYHMIACAVACHGIFFLNSTTRSASLCRTVQHTKQAWHVCLQQIDSSAQHPCNETPIWKMSVSPPGQKTLMNLLS